MFILQMFRGDMRRFLFSFCFILVALCADAQGIRTSADLVAFVEAINGGKPTDQWRDKNGHVCLESDIDMAKVKKLDPISSFGGVFDGKGYEIKNWKAKNGLFRHLLQGGVIRNLTIAESCVMKAGEPAEEEYFLSFIAHINNGIVENCVNKGTITHKSPFSAADLYIGGVVGSNRGLILKCRNYGDISSACISTVLDKNVDLNIGGIAGAAYNKTENKSSVTLCENYGKLSYSGDVPCIYLGGVIGLCNSSTVKYSVNRGDISVATNHGESTRGDRWAHVGGVAGHTRTDMIGCDNFGSVSVSGIHRSLVGGILGMNRQDRSVVDCKNYGDVILSSESVSSLGGIVGFSGQPVHIGHCDNFGEIKYEGFCPNEGSSIGGIVGSLTTGGRSRYAAYISSCVNYGNVSSGSGGNNYENDKAIHTGGIAGKLSGNSAAHIKVRDCENRGVVTAVTGKKNPVAPLLSYAKVFGTYYDAYAQTAQPKEDGANIFGRVLLADGTPVPGVVVSDGLQCVQTGNDGSYSMKADLSDTRLVFVSLPSGYDAELYRSVPQIFKKVRRHEQAVKADFVLNKREGEQDEYTMVMIGDAQMRGLGYDNSGERFRDVVIPDIEKLRGDDKNFYSIHLGDVVYNIMTAYDDYMDCCSSASFPIFNLIGNHDIEQFNLYHTKLATGFFESYLCPSYYSFDLGNVHYIILNTITSDGVDPNGHYGYGVTDEQIRWLQNDLKYVPEDKTLAICSHALLFMKGNRGESRIRNFKELRNLLAPYNKVYAWAGHSHWNYGYDYVWENSKITGLTVARCNGVLRSNREICADGQPNGYMVVSVKGGDMQWYYKSIGKDKDHQMTVYSPARTKDGYVKANIYNYTKDFWQVPQWYENGVLVGELEQFAEPDLDYVDIFENIKGGLSGMALNFAKPQKSRFMFRIKPSEGVRQGEVRVTDNFGNTYSQTIEW